MSSQGLVPLKASVGEAGDPNPIQGRSLGIGRLFKIFGGTEVEEKEKLSETESESIFSDDSGLNSSRNSDESKVMDCEIDLPKEILQLAGDTWPLKEGLLFR